MYKLRGYYEELTLGRQVKAMALIKKQKTPHIEE